jgi:hypothetical protein
MANKFLNETAPKWLIFAIYGMFFLTLLNTCGNSNRSTENKNLRKSLDSLTVKYDNISVILIDYKTSIDGMPKILQDNDDKQTAKFLYWERQADSPSYKTYTIKDYYEAIKK